MTDKDKQNKKKVSDVKTPTDPDHVKIFDTTLRDGEQCPGRDDDV